MGGDITRSTFHRKKHYRKVGMQQGRVQLDADWNEQVDIDSHHEGTFLDDVVGHSGTPVDSVTGHSDGFKVIQPTGLATLPPTIFLIPPAGPPGTSVTVYGYGLPPGATVNLESDGTILITPATDKQGSFGPTQTAIPSAAQNGPMTVSVTDIEGNVLAGSVFTVSGSPPPTIFLIPPAGPPGTSVTVYGCGLPFSTNVYLVSGKSPNELGSVTTTSQGFIPSGAQITIPSGTQNGPLTINAMVERMAGRPLASCAFIVSSLGIQGAPYWIMKGRYYVDGILCENEESIAVTRQPDLPLGPFIFLSPSAGPASTTVTVSGMGFAPSSTISLLTFGGASVLPTTPPPTDKNGAFTCQFNIPSNAANGAVTITTSDGTNSAEAAFTVAATASTSPLDTVQVYNPLPSAPGVYAVFLDVWERELSSIEDPSIREVALLGPDTATRKKVVWQVKALQTETAYIPTPISSQPSPPSGLEAGSQPSPGMFARIRATLAREFSGRSAVSSAPSQANISLSPNVAAPGTPIAISGTGFQKGEAISLTFPANLTTPQGTQLQISADVNGNVISAAFLVPEIPPGNYTLSAKGNISGSLPPRNFTVTDCSSADGPWTSFVNGSKSTGRLRARAALPAPNSQPCIIPPQSGYTGLENQLYRVEVHVAGQVASGSSQPPTFKWSRNNASVLAGITGIASNVLTVTGTGKDGNLGFAGDPAQPPVWVEVVSDMQELWGKIGTLAPLTNVGDDTLTFDATQQQGPNIDGTNYPPGMNPKVRRWDSDPSAPSEPDNTGYVILENGIQVRFEPGQYNVGDYWLIPARTITGKIEWPQQTTQVDWSKITNNTPAPSDSSALADYLIQTTGYNWIQGQQFSQNASNPNEIDVTSSDGKNTLSLILGTTPPQVTIELNGQPIGQTISVVSQSGSSMLQCVLPAPLLPMGIEHHFERLALVQVDGSGNVIPISDCRELFPALTDVPRLFYVSGDGQTANPDGTLPAPLMAATWFGKVRFTIVKGSGTLSNPFDSTVPSVSGQGSFLDVVPGSGTPNSTYPDLDGIASCSWVLDTSTQKQLVRAELLDTDGNLTDQTPLYYSAVLQSGQAQATTGIIELPIANYMQTISSETIERKRVTYVFGAFKHFVTTSGVPPAIILGYVGFRSSMGGDFPALALGRVTAMEDAGLYPFGAPDYPAIVQSSGQNVPYNYLNPFSTQANAVYSTQAPIPIPLFKALFVDDNYFSVGVDNVVLPPGTDTLILRWWAVPAADKGEDTSGGNSSNFWWPQVTFLRPSPQQAEAASGGRTPRTPLTEERASEA